MATWREFTQKEGKGILILGLISFLVGLFLHLLVLLGLFREAHLLIALAIGARNGGIVVMILGAIKMLSETLRSD